MRHSVRRRRFAAGLGSLALALFASSVQAATYYVRSGGSDFNSGLSPAAAWATVAHAANVLVAGDTVYVGAGTYTDAVDVQNSGTAANPIVFVADVDGSFTGDAGAVVVSAGGNVFNINNEDYIQVLGFRVSGGLRGFRLRRATGIVVRDCEADGSSRNGFELDDAAVQIESCDVHNHGMQGIRVLGTSTLTLLDSSVHDNGDEGITLEDNNAALVARRCDLYANGADGLGIGLGSALVVNCLVRGNAGSGIWLQNFQSFLEAWHATIVGNNVDGVHQRRGRSTVTNSILAFNGDDGLDRNGGPMTHSYNLVFGNGGLDYEGTGAGAGEINLDPQFLGAGDYHLGDSSPALDAGIDASAQTSVDLDGNARPSGSGWDMGAYERPFGPHFAIGHDGAGSGCIPEPVTIEAHDASHVVDGSYSGTISLTTSTGNGSWSLLSGAGTFVPGAGGSASYSFAGADAGRVVLGLQNPNIETTNIDVTDGTDVEDPSEDPDLVFGGATETFRDDFGAVSYANDDGTQSWSGPWIEVDGAGAGPGAGNAYITGGELSLDDRPNTNLDTSVEREADLSSYGIASFSFDFRTTSGVDANDAVFAEVSADGGGSWTVLERITGLSGVTTGSRTYDITGWIAPNTRVRLRVDGLGGAGGNSCCYGGPTEEFLVDSLEIAAGIISVCGPDHFAIVHDGSAVNCQAENVTLIAHDSSHNPMVGYTGSAVLSTSTGHGDWSLVSGAGTLVNSGNGVASYAFDPADAGQVVLGLRDTFVETLSVNVAGDGAFELEDPDLVFDRAGFQFLADGVGSALGTQIAGKPSNAAPGQLLELQAIRTSDTTGACEAALQGVESVELAASCLDPVVCAGSPADVNGVSIAANPAGPPASFTAVDLDFGDATDTTATFVLTYGDVGQIQLHARKALAPSGELLAGSSNAFVVRPFGFALDVPGNPAATGPAGALFTQAGADFAVNVGAVLWQAADDADADGVPDGHANADPLDNAVLSDNSLALSFGQEVAPASVTLGALLYAPAGGTDPGLGGATVVTGWLGGSASSPNVNYDDVGVAELFAAVSGGSYLGIGAVETAKSVGRSGPVGRFRPDHFDVGVDTAPVFATACNAGGFTYQGQPFVFATAPVLRVTGRSALGTQTRNYTGSWWKLTNGSLANRSYSSDPASPGLVTTGLPAPAVDPTIVDLGDGSGTLTFDAGTGLRFARASAVAPFDAEIALSIDILDGDVGGGVAYAANPFSIGAPSAGSGIAFDAGKVQRFGRLYLENAYGSELSLLPEPLLVEYWTGAGFAVNGDDTGCTVLAPDSVGTTARSPAGLVTAPSLAGVPAPSPPLPLLSGDARLTWSAPGAAGFADVLVNLSSSDVATAWGNIVGADLPWLQWDWAGDGSGPPNGDPSARITFGIFDGDQPVIFRREVY